MTANARSGLAIAVPTTAGPLMIRGLRWSQRIPGSRVVLDNETGDQCERWTRDYNNLMKPGDPVRSLLGLSEQGGFRLVVTGEIDQGKSWLMPVTAAHFAMMRGEAPASEIAKAKLFLFTTGAIDFALAETPAAARVVDQDYELNAKIMNSRDLFAEASHVGTPVLAILPAGPDAERAKNALQKVLANQPHLVAIAGNLAELTAPIDSFLKHGDFKRFAESSRSIAIVTPPKPEETSAKATVAGEERPKAQAVPDSLVEKTVRQDAPPVSGPTATGPETRTRPTSAGLAGSSSTSTFQPVIPPGQAARGMPMRTIGLVAAAVCLVGGGVAYALLRPQAPPVTAAVPSAPAPMVAAPTPSASPAPVAQPAATPAAPVQPAPVAVTGAVVRLVLLTAPPGSSCQAQVMEMQPRFVETVVEAAGDTRSIEAASSGLCGLAVQGVAPVRARFAQTTGTMASLSGATRVVFQPGSTPRAPVITLEGAGVSQMDITLR